MNSHEMPVYIAEEITPKDDAFHGSTKLIALEWWYFDAILNNGYSVHIGCKTSSRKNRGLVNPMIEIYKDGKVVALVKRWNRFHNFNTSKQIPLVKLFNKPIIKFEEERYKKTGEWAYRVSMKIKDYAVNLAFIGACKGWKIETKAESWTVALPKATVTGEIIIKGKKINVEGIGYHDHNWNYTLLTAMNYGKAWYWGKIRSETMDVVWANIVKSAKKSEILAIVNQGKDKFFSIHPKKIHFKPDKFIRNHRKKIPTNFFLKINDIVNDIPINAEIKMEPKEIQYNRVLVAPYWRYHAKMTGFISVGSHKETIDNTEIMEFLSFS